MRAAPPVSVRGTGGRPWRVLQTLLFTVAAAVPAGWALLRLDAAPAFAWTAALVAAIVVAAVAWRRCAPVAFELRWDGQQWQADGVSGALDVMIDFGGWLLLRLRPAAGRARWLPLAAHEAGPQLHALRSAVYAGVSPATPITAPSAAR